jgi:hypothetical protein
MPVSNGNLAKNGELHTCTVKNANFRKVITVLEKFMQDDRYEFCHCERCMCEIAALSLNYLPPHYYVDPDRGDGIGSPVLMVEIAVIEAIGIVSNSPRNR